MASKKHIRYFSYENDWMDCVITVNEEDVERAKEVVTTAIDEWWEDDRGMGYGTAIEEALTENEILYNVRYHPDDNERWSEEERASYEKYWEESIPEDCETIE